MAVVLAEFIDQSLWLQEAEILPYQDLDVRTLSPGEVSGNASTEVVLLASVPELQGLGSTTVETVYGDVREARLIQSNGTESLSPIEVEVFSPRRS